MIRPMPACSSHLRLVTATVMAAMVVLGCTASTPTTAPLDPSASASPPGVDAGDCPVMTPPGPGDAIPGPGEMDVSDVGNGRWRVCLAEPVALEVEGSAWCTWTDDRSEVREASGLPVQIGGTDSTVDGGIAIDRGEVYLSSNDPRMIASWQGEPSDMQAVVGVAGRSGTVAFRIPAIVDPEHPPAVRPPEAAGVISWLCGGPPPPG
jgi:hypothetical protein